MIMVVPLTPTTSRTPLSSPIRTPGSSREISPTRTFVDTPSPKKRIQSQPNDKVAAIFEVHGLLVKQASSDLKLPFTNIVSLGGQTAGKSSVLSMISGISLWSSEGTATHGPTQIHSRCKPRPFKAYIKIELANPAEGVEKHQPFTEKALTLEQRDQMSEILRLAGDEARRVGNGNLPVRTYEELLRMDKSVLYEEAKGLPKFTPNTVILHVSGDQQADVSIVDLPGLNGSALVEGLAAKELQKEENLILLCLAAGGTDVNPNTPEMRLARKYDSTGARTMGIITKADHIEEPGVSVYTDLIRNSDKDFSTWSPEHGYWPLNLRNFRKLPLHEVSAREREMFASDEWVEVAKETDRDFGIEATKTKLYHVFRKMVTKHAIVLEKLIRSQTEEVVEAISGLPAEIDKPVKQVHQIIDTITRKLARELKSRAKYANQLRDTQFEFSQTLVGTVPIFVPLCSENQQLVKSFKPLSKVSFSGVSGELGVSGSEKCVFMDTVYEALESNTSRRDGSCNLHDTRLQFVEPHAKRCIEICLDHINTTYDTIMRAIEEVIDGKTAESPHLCTALKRNLQNKFDEVRSECRNFAMRICEREKMDPHEIDVVASPSRQSHHAIYENLKSELARLHRISAIGVSQTNEATLPEWAKDKETSDRVLGTMAGLYFSLLASAVRVYEIVGREVQGQVLYFLDTTAQVMRDGLGLEDPAEDTVMAMSRILEPSREIVEKRQTLKKRKRELEDVDSRLAEIHEF